MQASTSAGPQDGSLWGRFVALLSVLGTALILVVMAVMVWDVVARAAFDRPLPGTAEIVTMSIAAIVFLQMPAALAAGRFVRSDALMHGLHQRRPSWGLAIERLWLLLGLATFAMLAWAAAPLVYKDFLRGEVYGSPGVFTFPRWPVGCLVVLGCGATALQFALQALALRRTARSKS
jgi:TRAP-type mannitol/chloroaromatic compound transport system permease small subunit